MNKKFPITFAFTLTLISAAHAQPDSLWSRAYGRDADATEKKNHK